MKAALLALLLCGCSAIQQHPFVTAATANTVIVAGAGICAVECDGASHGASEGVLIGELALSSMAVVMSLELVIGYMEGR